MESKTFENVNFRILRKVISVLYYIIFIGMILFFIGGIVITILPESNFISKTDGTAHIQFSGMYDVQFDVNQIESINLKTSAIIISFSASIILLIITAILFELKKIFNTIAEKNPFDKKNSQRILIIGICLIFAGFIFNGIELFVISNLLNQINETSVELNYSPNLALVLTGCLVMVLASIFKYGTFLQEEFDATL